MMEAAYAGRADDPPSGERPGLDWPTIGRVAEARVESVGVVVGHVISQQVPEMTFSEDGLIPERFPFS